MHDATGRRALARALLAGALLASTFHATLVAAQPTAAQQSAIRSACRGDFQANCAGVSPGGQAALACLQQNLPGCRPRASRRWAR